MDESTLQSNINSVKEMLLDENKLVTYISISRDLCLHVNESKTLLSQLVDNIRKDQPDISLNINYIVSGLADKNKALTTVCSEADLNTVMQSLKNVFYQHIYSVGKGSGSVDGVTYMALNKFEDFPLCTGLIKSIKCTKRTLDEIGNLKTNSQELAVVDTKSLKKVKVEHNDKHKTVNVEIPQKNKTESKELSSKKNSVDLIGVVKVHETKSEPIIKSEVSSPKKDRKNQTKAQKGIAGFFNKSNSVPANKPKTNLSKNVLLSNSVEKVESVKVKDEKMDTDESKTTAILTKKENNNKSKTKSFTDIKKNGKVDKKRKRVLHVSDSESEDEKNDPFGDDTSVTKQEALESDDEIPPTPTVNTVKITSGIVNPKKRRKIVDKTYTDEDGYILTKKEEVYESCSENEAETAEAPKEKENIKQVNQVKIAVSPNKKNGTKNKKKVSPPQKGKQATLMNFFKKV